MFCMSRADKNSNHEENAVTEASLLDIKFFSYIGLFFAQKGKKNSKSGMAKTVQFSLLSPECYFAVEFQF